MNQIVNAMSGTIRIALLIAKLRPNIPAMASWKTTRPRTTRFADDGPGTARRMLAVVHGVEELVLVDEGADEEVEQAEEEDEPGAREDGVDDADDVDEDRLREVEAVAEDGRGAQLGVVAGRFGGEGIEGVEGDGAEFEEAEREEAETLEDDEVHVEEDEVLEGAGEHVGDAGGVFEGLADFVEVAGCVADGAEDGEDDEEVEEGEEEVLADEGHFDVPLGDHALKEGEILGAG